MNRGEVRWYTFRLPDKRRPVLLLSRKAVVSVLNELIVVPVTRTIRGISTEVLLTPDDGMPVAGSWSRNDGIRRKTCRQSRRGWTSSNA